MAEEIDLSPQELNLKLYSGDAVRFRVVITDTENQAVPITGTMDAQIRVKRGTGSPKAEFDIDLADADDGIAVLTLTGVQTQALAPREAFVGVWDLQWTPASGAPRTLCQGTVECDVDVSR